MENLSARKEHTGQQLIHRLARVGEEAVPVGLGQLLLIKREEDPPCTQPSALSELMLYQREGTRVLGLGHPSCNRQLCQPR